MIRTLTAHIPDWIRFSCTDWMQKDSLDTATLGHCTSFDVCATQMIPDHTHVYDWGKQGCPISPPMSMWSVCVLTTDGEVRCTLISPFREPAENDVICSHSVMTGQDELLVWTAEPPICHIDGNGKVFLLKGSTLS